MYHEDWGPYNPIYRNFTFVETFIDWILDLKNWTYYDLLKIAVPCSNHQRVVMQIISKLVDYSIFKIFLPDRIYNKYIYQYTFNSKIYNS